MRRRVTIGFLSIVCLLFFSGMVSFVELSHLSRDTGEILKANKRNIELAKEMLDAAYEQNVALIRLSVSTFWVQLRKPSTWQRIASASMRFWNRCASSVRTVIPS